MKIRKSITAIITMLATICILFSSCSSAEKVKLTDIITPEKSSEEFRTPSSDTLSIGKNDYVNFIFDKKTFTVNIKDLKENHTWTTLNDKNSENSCAFALTLFTKNGIYKLNTQDNSVAFGTAEYENKNGVLSVKYVLSDNAATAKKSYEEITKKDVYVAFTVTYRFSEQTMYVSIGLEDALLTPGSFITEFEVLPCLGSSEDDLSSDYFLIPDGSGAVMHLGTADSFTDSVSVNVYGKDPYTGDEAQGASAYVPVFGAKRGNSAFAAVITEGDALATINANRKTADSLSCVSAAFAVTPVKTSKSGTSVYKGSEYKGNIDIAYKFLSGNSANYTSMASAAREEFINNSLLKSSKISSASGIPFYLTVVGEAESETLTTTQQTLDILGILKGKGINNITLNYKGLLSGGLAQKDLYSADINKKLGGQKGLETLYEYTVKQGCKLIIGTDIFSSSRSYPINNEKTIDGKKAVFELKNDMSFDENLSNNLVSRIGTQAAQLGKEKATPSVYDSTKSYTMKLRKTDSLEDKFSMFLEGDIFTSADGISVSDAGNILYSSAETDRETAKNNLSEQLKAVSNFGELAVEGGNLYSLYNAEIVSDMEFGTFYTESSNYEPVPFVPAILHGYTHYTGDAIDAGDPLYRYEMLRFIEYGALPSYEWIYKNRNIFCYSGYLLAERAAEIADFYNDFIGIFESLADETMVSHKKIEKDSDGKTITGVYCTTYSDGTEIYVNYTGSIVSTPENIAIGPYDFVAVKR